MAIPAVGIANSLSKTRTSLRYSIRTLLIGVLATALLITGVRWMQWRNRWRGVRDELRNWASSVDRADGKIESYARMNNYFDPEEGFADTHTFAVLTGEPVKIDHTDGTTDWTTMPGLPEDPSRFFVVPPGIWVDDIGDVITAWDHHYNAGFHEP